MGKKLHILLVEDDDLLMLSFVDMLRDLDHDVTEASGAHQALDHINSGATIDVMITDINLPEMNGRELVKKARAILPNLPVIYSSGYSENKMSDLAGDPLLRYLEKPFGSEECEQALRSFRIGFVDAA